MDKVKQLMDNEVNYTADDLNSIAVVGLGCRYPGAENPKKLWENILTRRREFRRFPDQRLPVDEYYDADPKAQDKLYINKAAYIDGFEFDWIKRRIPKATVEATDIVQWLTLEVADLAIQDAGYTKQTLPSAKTGVIVGNSLTGEQSRASTMRIRWPFVKKTLMRSAKAKNLPKDLAEELAQVMEESYKSVFPVVDEDNLQGGLSNTIAGRVSNYFNLHGGGYNVDGACASSLLAICTAADHLRSGKLDIAIAGGVDVSLDTFELIGFAKTSALTPDDMTVYDERGNGFLPGEGCGFVVLKRLKDALAAGDEIYSVMKGWGVSSDGKGGMTAPSSQGQSRALQQAYNMAGYSPGQLDFVEGHGTGTRVGDRIELEGIGLTMEAFNAQLPRNCGMTSFKSIVGHTKAAAGVGAFIKTVMAVNRRILPPTANCKRPNPVFADKAKSLYPILQGEKRAASDVIRAGVSAMGFGGINSHITMQSPLTPPSAKFNPLVDELALLNSNQESELFIFSAHSIAALKAQIQHMAAIAAKISIAELTDLANQLASSIDNSLTVRAACKASNPEELSTRLTLLAEKSTAQGVTAGSKFSDERNGIWLANQFNAHKTAFLFPGQGSQQLNMARVLVERFDWAKNLVTLADEISMTQIGAKISDFIYAPVNRAVTDEEKREALKPLSDTQIAQPAICLASIIYGRYLQKLGVEPALVAGHSLGELTAFTMAGLISDRELIETAILRGKVMKAAGNGKGAVSKGAVSKGTMASIFANQTQVEGILAQVTGYAVIANLNAADQTVISGDTAAVEQAIAIAAQQGLDARQLKVSGAFHSNHMNAAADAFAKEATLAKNVQATESVLYSSASGQPVGQVSDVAQHFAEQMLQQVNFIELSQNIAAQCDLLIEVGPGRVLSNLAKRIVDPSQTAILSTASTANNDHNLNEMLATYFVFGGTVNWSLLFENRLVRAFTPADEKKFIDNPCERAMTLMEGYDEIETDVIKTDVIKTDVIKTDVIKTEVIKVAASVIAEPVASVSITVEEVAGEEIAVEEIVESAEDTATQVLIDMVAQRTGYPAESITADARLLDDLNLDSIKAGELVATFAKHFAAAGKVAGNELVNSTLSEIVTAVMSHVPALTQAQAQAQLKPQQQTQTVSVPAVANTAIPTNEQASIVPAAVAAPEVDVSAQALQVLKEMVEQRTGYPLDSIEDSSQLLDDLNLDSIKAGELIAAFAKQYDGADKVAASDLVNATLTEIVAATVSVTSAAPAAATPVVAVNMTENADNSATALAELKAMVEQRTGYPLDSIEDDSLLLDDLNLDSIKAGELIATFAKQYDVAGKIASADFVNATLTDIVAAVVGAAPASVATPIATPITTPITTTPITTPVVSTPITTATAVPDVSAALLVLKQLVEQRTGYPLDSIDDDSRLLDDLNLDSIKAGELIATFTKQYGAVGQVAANDFVNSTLTEIVAVTVGNPSPSTSVTPSSSATAVQTPSATAIKDDSGFSGENFTIAFVEAPANPILVNSNLKHVLIVHEFEHQGMATELARTLKQQGVNTQVSHFQNVEHLQLTATASVDTVIAVLPPAQAAHVDYQSNLQSSVSRLQAVVAIANQHQPDNVALVQFGGGRFGTDGFTGTTENVATASFLRSWSLERPNTKLRVLDLADNLSVAQIHGNLVSDLAAADNYLAIGYDRDNVRRLPKAMPSYSQDYVARNQQWTANDVIVITGGAKGITAECGLKLAQTVKAKYILLGSSPLPTDSNSEIVKNLNRFRQMGLIAEYLPCNLTDKNAVAAVMTQIKQQFGAITGLVHGAGINIPRLVSQVSAEQAFKEISPKLLGLRHLLNALHNDAPKMVVGMTSIIGIAGMTGNAWYAFANEAVDLLLRQYAKQQSQKGAQTEAVSLGYTVWKEVGMGHRLGVVDNLANSGVGALSVHEGTTRFAQLFLNQAADQQVAIIDELTGLSTWQQLLNVPEPLTAPLTAPLTTANNFRYVDNIVEQNAEQLAVRTRLNTTRDPYLVDHDFNGTYLMPTVFGLEAMAQVASTLLGDSSLKISEISNISLELPITVSRDSAGNSAGNSSETEIQIQARVHSTAANGDKTVLVGILTETTGFASEHFSAVYTFSSQLKAAPAAPVVALDKTLLIAPKTELYNQGGVLFQGPMFQRVDTVHALSTVSTTLAIRKVEPAQLSLSAFGDAEQTLLLSDPFYRDVLLQSVQLPLAPEFVLPVGIGKISFYAAHAFTEQVRYVQTSVNQQLGRDHLCDVTVFDAQGRVIEQLHDYKVRALQNHQISATPAQLSGLASADQALINQRIDSAFKRFSLSVKPAVCINYTPGLQQELKAQRHELEIPFIVHSVRQSNQLVDASKLEIFWTDEGKPSLGNAELAGHNLSLSHDDDYCISLFGQGEQGCDIEVVRQRSRLDWQGLLGNARMNAFDSLVALGDTIAIAGVRIWSAIEVVRKMGVTNIDNIAIEQLKDNEVVLEISSAGANHQVLSLPIQLAVGEQRVISVSIHYRNNVAYLPHNTSADVSEPAINEPTTNLTYDAQADQMIFEYESQVCFKECGNLSRTVYYTSYLQWVGKVRELFMADIAADLVPQVASGDWGLVTNWAELNIFNEAECYDKIKAKFRLGKCYDSVIPLHCHFYKIEDNGDLLPLAHVMQETTWVEIIGHGQVIPAEFPTYFRNFLDKTDAKSSEMGSEHAPMLSKGAVEFTAKPMPGGNKPFFTGEFNTCFEDANLVGNIYYANYFIWQGRVRNNFLGEVVPSFLKGIGEQGELLCVRSRMDYLRDAMPFDQIHVAMSLKALHQHGAVLGYQFYRLLADGRHEKLSVGEQEVVWVNRDANGKAIASPLPTALKSGLLNERFFTEAVA